MGEPLQRYNLSLLHPVVPPRPSGPSDQLTQMGMAALAILRQRQSAHPGVWGSLGRGKITHFRVGKLAVLCGFSAFAGEEGDGGCQQEWLLQRGVTRPAMGVLWQVQVRS